MNLFAMVIVSVLVLASCAPKAEISQAPEEPLGSEEAEIADALAEIDEIDQLSTDQAEIGDLDNLGIE